VLKHAWDAWDWMNTLTDKWDCSCGRLVTSSSFPLLVLQLLLQSGLGLISSVANEPTPLRHVSVPALKPTALASDRDQQGCI